MAPETSIPALADNSQRAIKRALISVYDKTGLSELAQGLHEAGVSIVSTGSTATRIAESGVPVAKVEDVTGFAECLEGRVKTLHPRVHAGEPGFGSGDPELGVPGAVLPAIPGPGSRSSDFTRNRRSAAVTKPPSIMNSAPSQIQRTSGFT